jgi:hypothetical protein
MTLRVCHSLASQYVRTVQAEGEIYVPRSALFRAPIVALIASGLWIVTLQLPIFARVTLRALWFVTAGLIVLSLILLGYFLAFVFHMVRMGRF